MLSPFSNIQFQLVATPHTIKHVGEKGEVQFSRRTPIFWHLCSLSLWSDSSMFWNYKIGQPRMKWGSELDPSMNEP